MRGLMVADLYRWNRQFETIEVLKESIRNAWDKINQATLLNLLKLTPTENTSADRKPELNNKDAVENRCIVGDIRDYEWLIEFRYTGDDV